MNDDLEHRMKLWKHLAEHGNLMCSAAWYKTPEQARFWADLSDRELKNPESNSSKEKVLLGQLFGHTDLRKKLAENNRITIFDFGS